ncbi:BMP family ABC transporter substrate-binding protein [Oscillibacter sp. MSJ-2]|uniref:BMP family ABC transporter substrate-binding protein n=1 Tax=Dysosmobacter acutus TaxID=2841504 RepID=A0ABS6F9M3_9FIRM|nr:BMP family ABC transporter substrate-binding protein [Dysosmobacter acutus]MBU5627003.1 BMP family ABC transporter substrate-binding protein [Dysosmobacter acutus]
MKKLFCKRLFLAAMAVVMLLGVLTGCGGTGTTSGGSASAGSGSASQSGENQKDPADYKVAVLTIRKMTTPADLNTLEGIERLRDEMGIDCKIVECVEIAEYKEQMQAVCEENYDVVYFIYDNFLEAAKELAPLYPETLFIGLWIDLGEDNDIPNLKPLHFRSEQGAFMCGVAAALKTETDQVAFLGGGINPGIVTFLAGYEAGIKYINPDCELVVSWANTFDDPLKGKELASSLYSRGVDVIFQAANQTGLGVFEAAKEAGKYAIGVDVDQSDLAPENIISSCLLDHGFATYDSISKAYNGEFTNEQVYYGLAEGIPVIALNEDLLDEETLTTIKEVEQKIIDGEIEIPKTTETK